MSLTPKDAAAHAAKKTLHPRITALAAGRALVDGCIELLKRWVLSQAGNSPPRQHAPRLIRSTLRAMLLLPALVSTGVQAIAGDENWDDQFNAAGFNGSVEAVTVAANGDVYVGGEFSFIRHLEVNHVAKWDSAAQQWQALGSGVGRSVSALATDSSGNLYAGGQFATAGGVVANRVAKWDSAAQQWQALGSGLGATGSFSDDVYALTMDSNGILYAGGSFTTAGGTAANNLANWDSNTQQWQALSTGVNGRVFELTTDSVGNLYAGGLFTTAGGTAANHIAKWDSATQHWQALGSGIGGGGVTALTTDSSGNVYAGGWFSTAGGTAANKVAKWDSATQQWQALGSGVDGQVNALATDSSGNVYAGGGFTTAGGTAANHIAKWDSATQQWQALDSGMDDTVLAMDSDSGGNIYAGGRFATAGGTATNHMAKWDSSAQQWQALGSVTGGLGLNGSASALTTDSSGNLYAGGYFKTAGGIATHLVAKLDSATQQWQALGAGVGGSSPSENVAALTTDSSGNLYASGFLSTAGETAANYIARWDSATQQWQALGSGLGGNTFALTMDSGGNLYAGGHFTTAGGSAANHVAKWDGTTQQWQALSSGMDHSVSALTTDSSGNLYAGGSFTTAGGTSASYIAKWDSATQQWQALGSGMDGPVLTLRTDSSGNLYAGGYFSTAGGTAVNHIAKWDSAAQQWQALGSGIAGSVSALATDSSGNIYAGSSYTTAGGTAVNNIAKWDSAMQQWQALGSGMNDKVHTLAADSSGNLYAGGLFTTAGGKASSYIARWNNAAASIPTLSSPTTGSTLSGISELFSWEANGTVVDAWWVYAGSTPGSLSYFNSGNLGSATSVTVNGLPTDGSTVHVRLWYHAGGVWQSVDGQYTATSGSTAPGIISPVPGDVLSGGSETFNWQANGTAVDAWWVYVGPTPGSLSYYNSGNLGSTSSDTVSGLPTDGSTVHVRLWFQVSGIWLYIDEQYTAATIGSGAPAIVTPASGSVLTGNSEAFSWQDNGTIVDAWWVYAGPTTGSHQYYDSGNLGTVTNATISGLPTDGSTVHVRLWYRVGSVWQSVDEQYTAAIPATSPAIVSPAAGSELSGGSEVFNWQANGTGVVAWWIYAGATVGSASYYSSGNLGSATNDTVSGLPSDGSTVHVRLWYRVGSSWLSVDEQYTATGSGG